MFTGEIAVSQRFLNATLQLLVSLFQLHSVHLLHHSLGFFPGSSLALLSVDCLENFGYQLHFGVRRDREYIAAKMNSTPLVFGIRKHFSYGLQHVCRQQ